MDLTYLYGHAGLDARQLTRLDALERSTKITGMQRGEARFYAMQGTPEQRERALQVIGRGNADSLLSWPSVRRRSVPG